MPFLKLAGVTLGGWLVARAAHRATRLLALASPDTDRDFLQSKLQTAQFYMTQVLPQTLGLAEIVRHGARSVLEAQPDLL